MGAGFFIHSTDASLAFGASDDKAKAFVFAALRAVSTGQITEL